MNQFVISWCQEGLEGIVPITDLEKEEAWNILQGKKASGKINSIINMMILRAKVNSQRRYEVYVMDATDGITEDDLRTLFTESPQAAADLIRGRGRKLFSDRVRPDDERIVIK